METGIQCVRCIQEHELRHDDWTQQMIAQGFSAESIAGPEWIDTNDNDTTKTLGFMKNDGARFCCWCEMQINVTTHFCKTMDDSIDCNDLISKLKVK